MNLKYICKSKTSLITKPTVVLTKQRKPIHNCNRAAQDITTVVEPNTKRVSEYMTCLTSSIFKTQIMLPQALIEQLTSHTNSTSFWVNPCLGPFK